MPLCFLPYIVCYFTDLLNATHTRKDMYILTFVYVYMNNLYICFFLLRTGSRVLAALRRRLHLNLFEPNHVSVASAVNLSKEALNPLAADANAARR
jgi:hypothetical protein